MTTWTATAPEAVRTLRTNRETTPEGFHDEVLSDHIPPTRKTNQQVSAPPTHPGAEDGTSQAWEVIRDAYVMASADVLFHEVSNVATGVAFLSPTVEMRFVDQNEA